MVSRYTCGLAKVKIVRIDKVDKRLFELDASISIALLDLNTAFILRIPYPASQSAEKPKRKFDI